MINFMATSTLPDLTDVKLTNLDPDITDEAIRRVLPEEPSVPVAAFNSAI